MADARGRVLFLCTHNSARSQMAEGLLGHLAGERFKPFSAGAEATHVRPEAIEVMRELGVDISRQEAETLDRYLGEPFDYVVTVCDDASEACPVFLGARERLHWSLPDPSAVTGEAGERMQAFRSVRDQIELRIRGWLEQSEVEPKRQRKERERLEAVDREAASVGEAGEWDPFRRA